MRRLAIDYAKRIYQLMLAIICSLGERVVRFRAPDIPDRVQRVLIVHPGGDKIGDAILFSPLPRLVKKRFPEAVVHLMIRPQIAEVYRHNPDVDELILWEEANRHPYLAQYLTSFFLFRRFRPNKYDVAIMLGDSFQHSAAVFLSGIPVRAGFNTDGRGFLHNVQVPLPRPDLRTKKDREYYLDCVRALGTGVGDGDKATRLYPGDEAQRFASDLIRSHSEDRPVITIHPGAGWIDRCWPDECWAQLADHLVDAHGASVAFIGGNMEVARVEHIMSSMHHEAVDLSGRLSITQMAAVIQQSIVFVGNDGGPAQIPGAVGTSQVTLFGPADPEFWEPYCGRLGISIFHRVECCPCDQNFRRRDARCKRGEPLCMQSITVEEVASTVESILVWEKSGASRKKETS